MPQKIVIVSLSTASECFILRAKYSEYHQLWHGILDWSDYQTFPREAFLEIIKAMGCRCYMDYAKYLDKHKAIPV